MEVLTTYLVCGLYAIATVALASYGLHLYLLLFLVRRKSKRMRAHHKKLIADYLADTPPDKWPTVTSQIPIYNEAPVAERVIEAVARQVYPAGRHEVQVLDDSTDETRQIIDRVAERLRAEGLDVKVVRRPTREGFKAGALAYGLTKCRGRYVAVFDADFVPPPEFVQRAIPLLEADPRVCCAQGRWAHLNPNESWLTRALSLGMDGHFAIEQGARCWNGFLLNFNGTAGIWRKEAIEDPAVGGWDGDTLTEDLDLSYRAQLAGWKISYCLDLPCPAELPASVNALKTQQRRWAKGSIQVAVKLLPRVWRSDLKLSQKLEATLHLTHYLVAVGMVILPLVAIPLLFNIPFQEFGIWLGAGWGIIMLSAAAPPIVYSYARYSIGGGLSGLLTAPLLMVVGMGLSLNNAVAALSGLFQRGGVFERTPKRGSVAGTAKRDYYRPIASRLWCAEIVMGLYSLGVWMVYTNAGHPFASGFMLLYAAGFLSLGFRSRPGAAPKLVALPKLADASCASSPGWSRAATFRPASSSPALVEPGNRAADQLRDDLKVVS